MMNDTISVIERVLTSYLMSKPAEELLCLLSEDFYACGLANDEAISGIAQAAAYISRAGRRRTECGECIVDERRQISDDAAVLSFTVTRSSGRLRYRAGGITRLTDGERKLCALHISPIAALDSAPAPEAAPSPRAQSERRRPPEERSSGQAAAMIDIEKASESRLELERKRIQSEDNKLLYYFISNVMSDRVLEHKSMGPGEYHVRTGMTLDELMRQSAFRLRFDADRQEFHAIHDPKALMEMYQRGETQKEMEYQMSIPDSRLIWVRFVLHLLPEPSTGSILLYEYLYRVDTEKMLEEMLHAVLDSGFDGFGILNLSDNQYKLLELDPQSGRPQSRDYKFDELVADYADRLVHPEDRELYLQRCRPSEVLAGAIKQQEFRYRTLENGLLRYKKCNAYLRDEARDVCLLMRYDITDIVHAEEYEKNRLKEALDAAEAATRAKSEFLSRMSHEIRTPMNAIMGMTAIAKENRSNFQQVAECLDKIDMSSHYLLTLINDILEMSRIESGRMEIKNSEFSFDFLIESIRTVVEPLAVNGDVRYEFLNEAKTEPYYRGDMMRIQQVMVNLLTNAVKFTKPGGRVRFSLRTENQTDAMALFRFSVADTGIGMSEEFMGKMFRPFVQEDGGNTSQYSGSGLGLAISKSLVEAMGGTIEAESFRGVGSTFTVILPLERVQYAGIRSSEITAHPGVIDLDILDGANILMAEDHHLNVMVARKLLERKGVQVTVADNGQMAVDLFSASGPGYYNAILMDIRMPVLDGLDAARAIRAMDRPDAGLIPIIAMTANALDEDRRNSHDAGMNAHLAKPFEPAQLYSVLAECISEARKHE